MSQVIENRRIETSAVERLRAAVRGPLFTPGVDGYDETRRVWNAAIDRRPAIIAQCTSTVDVMHALEFAREESLDVAVRGGGHSVPGFSVCDGGLVIDLTAMKGILTDPSAGTVRAQGGVTWGGLDRETQQFGLATTGGTVSTTGIAGLTLGGGIGWLARRYGLACDNLLSVDVVTADGRFVRASETESPDLFWGLRGGGGNFGIATAFEYRLHPVGPVVFGGPVAYDPSMAGDVLRAFRDLSATAPNELAVDGVLMGVGPEDTPAAVIAGCHAGPVEEGERLLAPARGLGEPLLDGMAPMPYVVLQALLDDKFPHGQFHYWTARTFDGLSDAVLDLIVERWRNARLAMVPTILIEGLGGAISAVPPDATAYGDREASYQIAILAVARDSKSFEACAEWGRSLLSEIEPHSRGGGYVNYLDDGGEGEVRVAYRDRYERLAQLKTLYDPENVFRLNQNIPPAR
jgi:hypothetical protein